jgi:peptide/nickel transport system permease protein
MSRFVASRLIQSLFVLWAVASATFLLVHVIPGDPARGILGNHATPETLREVRHQLGLDVGLPHAYAVYMTGLLHGDFGTSIDYRPLSAMHIIGPRIAPSVLLVLYTLVISAVITGPLAIWAALRRDRLADHAIRGLSTIGFVMPSFWLGLLLAYLFGVQLHLLPVLGYQGGIGAISSLTLPALTLALSIAPFFVRSLRSSTIDTLSSEFVRATRARGLSNRRVVVRHVLRNSLVSTVTLLGVMGGTLLSLTVIVENVFGIPGLGALIVQSVNARDYPVVQATTIIFALGVVLANFLSDLAYARLDPRVRL